MKQQLIRCMAIVGVVACCLGTLQAQQPAEHQHSQKPAASPKDDTAIFCPTMRTGQLCSHGTANVLQLSGANRDRWIEAARRYNKAVEAATEQLQQDAKNLLTPEQMTEVERWFAKGLNPQINTLLQAPLNRNRPGPDTMFDVAP